MRSTGASPGLQQPLDLALNSNCSPEECSGLGQPSPGRAAGACLGAGGLLVPGSVPQLGPTSAAKPWEPPRAAAPSSIKLPACCGGSLRLMALSPGCFSQLCLSSLAMPRDISLNHPDFFLRGQHLAPSTGLGAGADPCEARSCLPHTAPAKATEITAKMPSFAHIYGALIAIFST